MISVKSNADTVEKGLLAIADRLQKIEKIAAPGMRSTFKNLMAKTFSSEGGSGEAGKWAKLSEPYRTQKAKKFPGAKILVRTRQMKKELVSNDAFDSFTAGTESRYRWEINSEYWQYHQAGTSKMPSRKTIDMKPAANKQYLKVLNDATQEIIKGQKVFDHVSVNFPRFDKVE